MSYDDDTPVNHFSFADRSRTRPPSTKFTITWGDVLKLVENLTLQFQQGEFLPEINDINDFFVHTQLQERQNTIMRAIWKEAAEHSETVHRATPLRSNFTQNGSLDLFKRLTEHLSSITNGLFTYKKVE